MRIISGLNKGKKLIMPNDKTTRPLKDLAKESIFNILTHSNYINFHLKNSKVLELYACSFTWLKSSETYLICSVSKSEFIGFKNCLSSVKFHFLKVIAGNDSYKDVVNLLNTKLATKDITDVSIIDTKVEMLISVKT